MELPPEYADWVPPPGYKTQSEDTDPRFERLLFDLMAKRPLGEQMQRLQALNRDVAKLQVASMKRLHPDASDEEIRLRIAVRRLGRDLVVQLCGWAPEDRSAVVEIVEAIDVARAMAAHLERLGVPYLIGGALASGILGEARSTEYVDLVADLQPRDVKLLVESLGEAYYVSESAVTEGVERLSSFNVIHLGSLRKVDVFVLSDDPLQRSEMARRQLVTLPGYEDRRAFLPTPEDIVLQKLKWYRDGREISERQWRDVQGVLKLRRGTLDRDYLQAWAARTGLQELLSRALREAGLA